MLEEDIEKVGWIYLEWTSQNGFELYMNRLEGRRVMYIPNIKNTMSKGVEVVVDGRYGAD